MLSWRRAARAGAVTVLAACLGALLPATTAHAADRTVQGGRLDWGIKSSFQSYVTGPVAGGSWTLGGGAATVGSGSFRFHSATGSYDPDTGAMTAGFSGTVRFVGHEKADGTHELDLTIGRPTVRMSGGSGTLHADMTSKDKATGKVTSSSQVPLATLGLSGIDMTGGSGPITLNNLPATLTSQGATAFAGYYTAGTALDPVSLSADLVADSTPADGKSDTKQADDKSDTKKDDSRKKSDGGDGKNKAGRIEDAAVDWGVRRTFREYVTGSIAQGRWKLSAGAQDGGALFRFPRGEGTYDSEKGSLDADFAGTLRFTGEHGLDLALSEVAVTVKDSEGTLRADVASKDFTEKDVPLVTFAAKDLKPKDGLAALTEAPAKLTADGAKAFGGMYRAGTAMDPVSLAVALEEKAQLPPLPDLGSTPSAAPEAAAKSKAGQPEPTTASSSAVPNAAVITVGAVVLAAGAAAVVLARRRRTAPASPTAPTATETSATTDGAARRDAQD